MAGGPLAEALTPSTSRPTTWSELAAPSGCLLLFALVTALFALGAWTAVAIALDPVSPSGRGASPRH